MNIHRSLFGIACRAVALSFLMAGTVALAHAQQSASIASTVQAPFMLASESASASLASAYSSSSSSSDAAAAEDSFNLDSSALGSSQPPPRRRYGRPNYASGNSNADGSEKYTFLAGVGLAAPVGNTHKYETTSYGFQFGGGRNFNKVYGLLAQFDYDHFGLQGATIANQEYVYNYYCTSYDQAQGYCSLITDLDGNNHVWSFTLNPTFTLPTEGSLGVYAVVGTGFYHKVTNFTVPTLEEECYYYCGDVVANENIDHYTSNAVGVSGGFGLTYKISKFSNERFYMEARYVFMGNQQRYGVTAQNVGTTFGANYSGYNDYPQNSNRTTYIPVKFGIRF